MSGANAGLVSGSGLINPRYGGGGYGGGYVRGTGKLNPDRRPTISLSAPVVAGSIDKSAIQRVISRSKNRIRRCYEVELQRNTNIAGRIKVQFIISANGTVVKVKIKSTTLKNSNVERCLVAAIKMMRFPKPSGGGIVEVSYPFVFRP